MDSSTRRVGKMTIFGTIRSIEPLLSADLLGPVINQLVSKPKMSFSAAPKRVRSEVSSVIDLCSPVSVKPCRNLTPHQLKCRADLGSETELRPGPENVDHLLFPTSDNDDEYWEPAEYRTVTTVATHDHVCAITTTRNSDLVEENADENTPPPNRDEDIIDLCSSQESTHSESHHSSCSDSKIAGKSKAIDLTQECDDTYLDYHEESTQQDTVPARTSSYSGPARNDALPERFSLFSTITRGPSLQTLCANRPPKAPPLQLCSGSTGVTATTSIPNTTAVRAKGKLDIAVTEERILERTSSTIASTTAFRPAAAFARQKSSAGASAATAEAPKAKGPKAKGSISVEVGGSLAAPLAAPPLVRSSSSAYAKATAAAAAAAVPGAAGVSSSSSSVPFQSAFRSRFGEKTLSPLPSLPAGAAWEVVLLIDKRERSNAHIQSKLVASCIPCRLATLAVGDFLWVVRPKPASSSISSSSGGGGGGGSAVRDCSVSVPKSQHCWAISGEDEDTQQEQQQQQRQQEQEGEEGDTRASVPGGDDEDEEDRAFDTSRVFVLDCVAERKSISDLVSSFGDGRYMEQKSRLTACNLRSTLYIVEGNPSCISGYQKAITAAHIKTAMVSIHVDSGMHVLSTRSIDHTITSLQNLHRQVERRFRREHSAGSSSSASSCRYQLYAEFQSMYGKKCASTHRQLFGHQLRQISGCSTAVAVTLMNRFGTTARFMDELAGMGQAKAVYTLENMVNEVTLRRLGPKLARRLWQVYMDEY